MPRHPKKEIAEALRHAAQAGLTVAEIHRGHRWGEVRCLCGLAFAVWSTPRNAGTHAKQIIRFAGLHADHTKEEGTS
jgi:hypothetical protein